MYKYLFFILLIPSVGLAQTKSLDSDVFTSASVTMTIPDPYEPSRRLPIDNSGQIECLQSKLNGVAPEDCAKAKKFYSEQFANTDLRFSLMADQIKPHPKYLISQFLTPKGVVCSSNLTLDLKKLCQKSASLFKSYDKEEQQMLISELEQKLPPTMLVPLTGKLKCEWSKLSKENFANCQKQNLHLDKMLFEERLKHNDRATMINQLVAELQNLESRCN